MLTTFLRIIKSGCSNFWRNKWLSISAISILSLTIFVITSLLLFNVLTGSLIQTLQDKIDISVYFSLGASEDQVLDVRGALIDLDEIQSVEYVSAEDALDRFEDQHQDNQVLMQSLRELEDNPLGANLNIKTQTASQYEQVVNFLGQSEYQEIIDKINYKENEAVITKLASITQTIYQSGLFVSLVLALIAVLVAFNTIRLAIYSAREEINVMRLVGASKWFIRGPFVAEGIFYGMIAAIFSLVVFYPLLWFLSPKFTVYLPGSDLFYYFQVNFWLIFLSQLAVGMVLGVASSLVAIRRYLKER